jgi:hypothetical protein
MMGATSVSRDEIAKTTREYEPNFVGIDSDDISCMLYATQLLMRIEMTAAEQSLTMKECNDNAATHGPQHKRAEAAGKLIKTVLQWESADAAASPSRQRAPPMPTLLGGNKATMPTRVATTQCRQAQQRRRRTHRWSESNANEKQRTGAGDSASASSN